MAGGARPHRRGDPRRRADRPRSGSDRLPSVRRFRSCAPACAPAPCAIRNRPLCPSATGKAGKSCVASHECAHPESAARSRTRPNPFAARCSGRRPWSPAARTRRAAAARSSPRARRRRERHRLRPPVFTARAAAGSAARNRPTPSAASGFPTCGSRSSSSSRIAAARPGC